MEITLYTRYLDFCPPERCLIGLSVKSPLSPNRPKY